VGTVSKSVGRYSRKRLGQGLWTAVAAGVGFPVHRAAVSTGRGRGDDEAVGYRNSLAQHAEHVSHSTPIGRYRARLFMSNR
jgi:hypothetical protein